MNKKNLAILVLLACGSLCSQGQELPLLKEVQVKCAVSFQQQNGMYYFTYDVRNDLSSVGNIIMFNIDISTSQNSIQYDTSGLRYRDDGFTEKIFQNDYPVIKGKIVPVGFPSMPLHWFAGVGTDLAAGFGGDSRNWIKPGSALGGFVIMSKGLPGIRSFVAIPDYDPTKYFPDPDEYPESDTVNIDSVRESLNYYGKTLGPTAPPLDFSASSWIDTLISYKHQSVTLGWLKEDKTHKQDCDEIMNGRDWYKKGDFEKFGKWNPTNDWDFDRDWNNGIVEVLDRRLDRAKTELSKRDSVGARRDLQIFVMEVELLNNLSKKLEDRKQAPIMTSEAYALLKYNAEYLIEKLPEGRGKN
ncbi:MAG TPA: hypothetical protein VLX91_11475 [Candidatus Acidoferrales bacterium]|nr:hypothetical protein [Candidatus Acidoferrales bacterium]